MVRKKNPSKRMSTRKRTKIERKVREHNRKARKGDKKKPTPTKAKLKAKDPGIPNSFPGKAEMLREAEEAKLRHEEEKKRQREKRRQLQDLNRGLIGPGGEEPEDDSVEEEEEPLDSKKTHRALRRVLERANILVQVLDARDPLGSRSMEAEDLAKTLGEDKKVILVLNKADLVPKEVVSRWLAYFREKSPKMPCLAISATQGGSVQSLVEVIKGAAPGSATLGVIGFPAVGKKTLVRHLKQIFPLKESDRTVEMIKYTGDFSLSQKNPDFVKFFRSGEMNLHNMDSVELVQEFFKRANLEQLCQALSVPKAATEEELFGHLSRQRGITHRGDLCVSLLISIKQGKTPHLYVNPPGPFELLAAPADPNLGQISPNYREAKLLALSFTDAPTLVDLPYVPSAKTSEPDQEEEEEEIPELVPAKSAAGPPQKGRAKGKGKAKFVEQPTSDSYDFATDFV